MAVGRSPVLWHEADIAAVNDLKRAACDALAWGEGAGRRGLTHCDKPLIRQHRFDHGVGAIASGHHQRVFFSFN